MDAKDVDTVKVSAMALGAVPSESTMTVKVLRLEEEGACCRRIVLEVTVR